MNLDQINPWGRHYQSPWRERAADTSLPLWQRVAFLAYGTHRANGHANFKLGEVAAILGKPADQISRALRQSKQKGWLAPASTSRCLVVPPHAIAGGVGHPNEVCAVHTGKRTGHTLATIAIGHGEQVKVSQ